MNVNDILIQLPAMSLDKINLLLDALGELPTKRGYELTQLIRTVAMDTLNKAAAEAGNVVKAVENAAAPAVAAAERVVTIAAGDTAGGNGV